MGAIRRLRRMTTPRPWAFRVCVVPVFWPGATGRPSAAPVSLAREPARTVLLPRRSPASCGAPRDRQPCPRPEHPLTQTAQAPAHAGRLGQDAAGDMHDLVGEAGDEQPHLVAGEGIHGLALRLQLLAAPMRLRPVGRGMSYVAPLVRATMANAGVGSSFNSPMCLRPCRVHGPVQRKIARQHLMAQLYRRAERGHEEEAVEQQIAIALLHHQDHPLLLVPRVGLPQLYV